MGVSFNAMNENVPVFTSKEQDYYLWDNYDINSSDEPPLNPNYLPCSDLNFSYNNAEYILETCLKFSCGESEGGTYYAFNPTELLDRVNDFLLNDFSDDYALNNIKRIKDFCEEVIKRGAIMIYAA